MKYLVAHERSLRLYPTRMAAAAWLAGDEALLWSLRTMKRWHGRGDRPRPRIFEVRRPGQLAVRFLIAFSDSLQLHDRIDFSHRLSVFDVREAT